MYRAIKGLTFILVAFISSFVFFGSGCKTNDSDPDPQPTEKIADISITDTSVYVNSELEILVTTTAEKVVAKQENKVDTLRRPYDLAKWTYHFWVKPMNIGQNLIVFYFYFYEAGELVEVRNITVTITGLEAPPLPPAFLSAKFEPDTLSYPGGETKLIFRTTLADSVFVSFDGKWYPPEDTLSLQITSSTSGYLKAIGPGGEKQVSLSVTVSPELTCEEKLRRSPWIRDPYGRSISYLNGGEWGSWDQQEYNLCMLDDTNKYDKKYAYYITGPNTCGFSNTVTSYEFTNCCNLLSGETLANASVSYDTLVLVVTYDDYRVKEVWVHPSTK